MTADAIVFLFAVAVQGHGLVTWAAVPDFRTSDGETTATLLGWSLGGGRGNA
jgi:hypothetical protein